MPLNLTDHQIERLIAGKTVNVRVKKKEGEWLNQRLPVSVSSYRDKFVVGKDYAVHSKGKAVWWCKECKEFGTASKGQIISNSCCIRHKLNEPLKKICATITEITQEECMKQVYKDEVEYCGEVWCLKCEAVK